MYRKSKKDIENVFAGIKKQHAGDPEAAQAAAVEFYLNSCSRLKGCDKEKMYGFEALKEAFPEVKDTVRDIDSGAKEMFGLSPSDHAEAIEQFKARREREAGISVDVPNCTATTTAGQQCKHPQSQTAPFPQLCTIHAKKAQGE